LAKGIINKRVACLEEGLNSGFRGLALTKAGFLGFLGREIPYLVIPTYPGHWGGLAE